MKTKVWTRLVCFLLCVTMIGVFAGCSVKEKPETPAQPVEQVSYSEMVAKVYDLNHYDVEVYGEEEQTKVFAQDGKGNGIEHTLQNDRITNVKYSADNAAGKYRGMSAREGQEQNTLETSYEYDERGNLTLVNNGGFVYKFFFDENDNFLYALVNGKKPYENFYDENNNLIKTCYENGNVVTYAYDTDNQLTSVSSNGAIVYSYENNGDEVIEHDYVNNVDNVYNKNEDLSVNAFGSTNGAAFQYGYDESGELVSALYQYNNAEANMAYQKDGIAFQEGSYKVVKDEHERVIRQEYAIGGSRFAVTKGYASDDALDTYVTELIINETKYSYEYDNQNNLVCVKSNGETIAEYQYDHLDQLIQEDNKQGGVSVYYAYDNRGNITEKVTCSYKGSEVLESLQFSYNEQDQLIGINDDSVIYDAYGNPTVYRDYSMTWREGTRLESLTSATDAVFYAYNAQGVRTSKTVNGQRTDYILRNNSVIYEDNGEYVLYFLYDAHDDLIGFRYEGEVYTYLKNAQGDIVGILDKTGATVVEYTYDAYGKILDIAGPLAETVGRINPYRYKSYRYDEETGFYYLISRYYDPEVGRFISIDNVIMNTINPEVTPYVNLYMYCNNNPIKYSDPTGTVALVIGGVTIGVGALILFGAGAVLGFLLIFYPKEITYAFNYLYNKIVDFFNAIKQAIPSLWDKWTKSGRPEIHHIVAKAEPIAFPARNALRNVGIGINDPINLIPLKMRFHRKLHRNIILHSVNALVVPQRTYSGMVNTLNSMRLLLFAVNLVA